MVVSLALIISTAGVLVLRPLAKRLGNYLDILAEERRAAQVPPPPPQNDRILDALENIEKRLGRLEERQSFTDQLLARGERPRLERGDES